MYALSAIATLGVWPYTIFGMMPTNKKLFEKYDEMKGLSVEEKATEVGLARGEVDEGACGSMGYVEFGSGHASSCGSCSGTVGDSRLRLWDSKEQGRYRNVE